MWAQHALGSGDVQEVLCVTLHIQKNRSKRGPRQPRVASLLEKSFKIASEIPRVPGDDLFSRAA